MRLIPLFACCGLAIAATAQTERTAFGLSGSGVSLTFATDYQCMGINPANLGWAPKYKGKHATLGLFEGGYSLHTDAFDKQGLKEDFVKNILGDEPDFTYAEKLEAAKQFDGKYMVFNGDIMHLGFSLALDSVGAIAFSVRDRAQMHTDFNDNMAEIMFMGYNAPYFDFLVLDSLNGQVIANDENVTDAQRDRVVRGLNSDGQPVSRVIANGSINFLWYREYGLSWGMHLLAGDKLDLYGGVGFKYLQGFGMIDIISDGGHYTGESSLSPGFGIDYGEQAANNPSTVTGSGMKAVGSGFEVDMGLSMVIADKVKFGVSYVDLGSMKWNGNVYTSPDSTVNGLDENGFDNYNIFDQADEFISDVGIFEWTGVSKIKKKMPSTLRMGAGYVFSKRLELGLDVTLPMNDEPGSIIDPVIAFGGRVNPAPWLGISLGVTTGGLYDTRMPAGILFVVPNGTWEAGFSTRDLLSIVGSETPTIGLCGGLLRFRF